MQRLAVLGGTFDPIHYGHLAIAAEVAHELALTSILVVPAAHQPIKHGQHSATPQQRLEMVRLACADNPLLVPSELEIRRGSPSYTVDTLRELRSGLGDEDELWFIMGADSLVTLPRWHRAAEMLQLARLAVVARPDVTPDMPALEAELPGLGECLNLIEGPLLSIDSTHLRQRIARGQPVRYQLPDSVIRYIEEHHLYQSHA